MENLKSLFIAYIDAAKPYAIGGGVCLVAGIVIGAWL